MVRHSEGCCLLLCMGSVCYPLNGPPRSWLRWTHPLATSMIHPHTTEADYSAPDYNPHVQCTRQGLCVLILAHHLQVRVFMHGALRAVC